MSAVPSPTTIVIPSPAMAMTADQLLARVLKEGGRPYRMRQERVFVLTGNEQLAAWLLDLGGRSYQHGDPQLGEGGYFRARNGTPEWDIWIHQIPVSGRSIWEALDADA